MSVEQIELSEKITKLNLNSDIIKTLEENQIVTVNDLVNTNIFELIAMEKMNLMTIASIKESLKNYGFTFDGADFIDISDFYDPNRSDMISKCQELIQMRNQLRKKEDFHLESICLLGRMCDIFESLSNQRKQSIINEKNTGKSF